MRSTSILRYSLLASMVLFGLLLGIFTEKYLFNSDSCKSGFMFINREIRCSKQYRIDKHEYVAVRSKINDYLERERYDKKLTRFSVYFRDLDNGPTFGINENDDFVPASLLKLPLAITYFELYEEDPTLFEKKLSFNWKDETSLSTFYKPSRQMDPDTDYTIEELVFRMLAHSDNVAYYGLLSHLKEIDPNKDLLLQTFRELGIIDPQGFSDETIYTKQYASILRGLYNASHLSIESSEKILSILSQSDFNQGIVSGVKDGTIVAHKFGERSFNATSQSKELHDCGVVYYPDNPYLLCVMTEGFDFSALSDVIKTVSKMVYEEVDSRKIN